jgi:hypothetical protein
LWVNYQVNVIKIDCAMCISYYSLIINILDVDN